LRIDYSPPKKSCSTASPQPGQNRPRKESSGGVLIAAVISGVICLGIGFSSGWVLSQRSTKEAFRKAQEQPSLESSAQQTKVQPAPQQSPSPAQQPAAPQAPQTAGTAGQPTTSTGGEKTADPKLSFYDKLQSREKSHVMGSGINTSNEKPAKQPLQAAMPANMTKPPEPENDEKLPKQAAPTAPAKPSVRQDQGGGMTVQVASYSLKSEAEAQRSKLASKGYNASIAESHLGDKGTWYRVRVGRRLDPDAAKELAGKLGKGAIAIPDKD
jgi:cell division protein FtsN